MDRNIFATVRRLKDKRLIALFGLHRIVIRVEIQKMLIRVSETTEWSALIKLHLKYYSWNEVEEK